MRMIRFDVLDLLLGLEDCSRIEVCVRFFHEVEVWFEGCDFRFGLKFEVGNLKFWV